MMASVPAEPGSSALAAALEWISSLLTGSLATSIGVIAIAGVGFAMLNGRLAWREGARVVLGCFVLFGAGALSAGLIGLARTEAEPPAVQPATQPPPAPAPLTSQPAFDPYAGASVPN